MSTWNVTYFRPPNPAVLTAQVRAGKERFAREEAQKLLGPIVIRSLVILPSVGKKPKALR